MKNIYTILFLIGVLYQPQINAQSKEVSREWASFSQSFDVSFLQKERKFIFRGKAKVITQDENAFSGLWARVDNKDGEMGFFDNMGNRPIQSNEWANYEIEGIINASSDKLNFGGISVYNGNFFFDDFELLIEMDGGEFKNVTIENPDFETRIINGRVHGWAGGESVENPISIKEFTSTSSSDRKKGKYSLMIEGKGIVIDTMSYYIGPLEEYDTQVGTLITMLNNLSNRVESVVEAMDQRKTDWLLDENANSIGSLIMHLAAAEALYQVITFEDRGFNEQEKEKWQLALELGKDAQKEFTGKSIDYYLSVYKEVRKKTLEEFAKRDDKWLQEKPPGAGISNYFSWFHVMEHQSSHLGQILLLQKRIPKIKAKIDIENHK